MRKFIKNVPALKCHRTNGKFALLLIISILFHLSAYSQQVVTNSNGEKIILNQNGSWSYLDTNKSNNNFSIPKKIIKGSITDQYGNTSSGTGGSYIVKIIEIAGDKFPYVIDEIGNIKLFQSDNYTIFGPDHQNQNLNNVRIQCSNYRKSHFGEFEYNFFIDYGAYRIYYNVDKNNDIFTMSYVGNGQFQLKKVGKVIDWSK